MTINQQATCSFTVTLAALRKAGACLGGYNKVVRALQGLPFTSEDSKRNSYIRFKHEGPISLLSILDSNGFDDALWALRCVPEVDRDARLYAVACARQVQSLMTDPRSLEALKVVERFANGEATQEELDAAWNATQNARNAAQAAWHTAGTAAWHAARAAWHAAGAALPHAGVAAGAAAWNAAWAVRDAAWHADREAWHAAGTSQKGLFIDMCNGKAPWQENP